MTSSELLSAMSVMAGEYQDVFLVALAIAVGLGVVDRFVRWVRGAR